MYSVSQRFYRLKIRFAGDGDTPCVLCSMAPVIMLQSGRLKCCYGTTWDASLWPNPAGQVWRTLCPLADIHPRDSLRVRQNSLPGTVGLNLGKKTKKEPNGILGVSVISFEGKRGKSVGRFVSTSDRSPSQRTENGSFPWVTAHRCIYAPPAHPHFCPSYF